LSSEYLDFEKARKIQMVALGQALPTDGRAQLAVRYVPKDIVGGDCYRLTRLDEERIGFFVADVSGHGVAGALYTMFLLSLCENNSRFLGDPSQFSASMNRKLSEFALGGAFATAVCGVLDLGDGRLTLACAGGPLPLLARGHEFQPLGGPGLPWGITEFATYEAVQTDMLPGDRVLLFTDGATEISTSGDEQIDTTGLVDVLRQMGYPGTAIDFQALERELLGRSDRIRFDDDVTFLELGLK
jgi:sigma-B regulation protein RsbU (phosphoserine phosphatase)